MNRYLCEAKLEEISIQRKEIEEYIGNIKNEPEYDIDLALYVALIAAKNGFLQKISGKAHDFSRGMKAPQWFF